MILIHNRPATIAEQALMLFFGICCWPIYTVLSNAARWWRKH